VQEQGNTSLSRLMNNRKKIKKISILENGVDVFICENLSNIEYERTAKLTNE